MIEEIKRMGCDSQFDVAGEPQKLTQGKLVKEKGPRVETRRFPLIKQYNDFDNLIPSLTPKTDAILMDVRRILADVLDFGYGESGTTTNGVYIFARRTKKGIKLRVLPVKN
jgi:hypothetical protein